MTKEIDLSVIIPTFNEADNISNLIDKIRQVLKNSALTWQIIVSDAGSSDGTATIAAEKGALCVRQTSPGYGGALKEAFKSSSARFIITVDADLSHNPYLIKRLLHHRKDAHIVIASRYIRGGHANMPVFRLVLSRILNKFICSGLSLPLTDVSSGLRLYDASIFKEINFSESDFSVLVEIVVKAYLNGFNVKEIPFHYQPRSKGRSHARIIKFGIGFLRVFWRMWKVRNTVYAADYDDRAFYSRIPAQRYWQRRRYKIICAFTGLTDSILDAGCGSSKILGAFPQAVGLDINLKKLRFNLSLGNPLCRADIKNLCFKNESFDCLICSEVIEHVPFDEKEFREFSRVIKKGGCLILGTPDYSKLNWIIIEKLYKMILPGGYADEHITRYTKKSLIDAAARHGFVLESHKYIMNAELICKFKKIS